MTTDRPTINPPDGLGAAGIELWAAIHADLPEGFELTSRESAIAAMAARQADDIENLQAAVVDDGYLVTGSTGQQRVHPAVAELRQARIVVSRLLGALDIPSDEDAEQPTRAGTARSQRASHAARARWAEVERRAGGHRGT